MQFNANIKQVNVIAPQVANGAATLTGSVDTLGFNFVNFALDVQSNTTPATTSYQIMQSDGATGPWVAIPSSKITFSASANGLAVWNISQSGGYDDRYLSLSGSQASGTASVCAIASLGNPELGVVTATDAGATVGWIQL